ncbi:MAG TPA: hypothetical protein PKY29_02155 [Ferruginibacter sp.]|nr:hypothetical protein [Ferruginibacter sp.]HRN78780.1 hypothetical protein [Ferruginibacter sp.]HRO16801.1 hypothetical protein [Ferruginibacter sp.]HRQ20084.1 hypothetical protein [Ferruginibacter sp.]
MSTSIQIDPEIIRSWQEENMNQSAIREKLQSDGWDEESIAHHLKAYMKAQCAKRQFTGCILLVSGALLGFISCVLTLMNAAPGMYHMVLYGLTSLAILLIFFGLYFIFE